MTRLDVHESKADIAGRARRGNEIVDQPIDLLIHHYDRGIGWIDVEVRVEQRMMVGDTWF